VRVDEIYIPVKGKWVYLYRAVDSAGATIDFLLSARRDAAAAERFLAKALSGANHPAPRVINTDKHAGYPPAIAQLKVEGALADIDRCSTLTASWNRITGPSNTGSARVSIFAPSGELGAQLPATRRSYDPQRTSVLQCTKLRQLTWLSWSSS
jgi:transposase-like protein